MICLHGDACTYAKLCADVFVFFFCNWRVWFADVTVGFPFSVEYPLFSLFLWSLSYRSGGYSPPRPSLLSAPAARSISGTPPIPALPSSFAFFVVTSRRMVTERVIVVMSITAAAVRDSSCRAHGSEGHGKMCTSFSCAEVCSALTSSPSSSAEKGYSGRQRDTAMQCEGERLGSGDKGRNGQWHVIRRHEPTHGENIASCSGVCGCVFSLSVVLLVQSTHFL